MTNTPKTDPVGPWPRNDLPPRPVYAPGLQEEKVVRFGLPPGVSRIFDAGEPGASAERLVEELQIELETLWQMSALAFATAQRVAHDQAQILARVLAALTQSPLARADSAEHEDFPSPVYPPDATPIVADGMIRSVGDIVAVVGESCRELFDIQAERLPTWVSTLRTISGWSGQTDEDRNNES